MNQAANANLFSRLFDGLDDPKRLAVETQDGAHISYGDLIARAGQMANVLVARGVKPGDRVAVQVEKSVANIVLYLATVRAGAVYLPLNTAYTLNELDYFIGDAEPSLVVCDPSKAEGLAPIAAKVKAKVETLGPDGKGSLTEAADKASSEFATVSRANDDLAAILYTSGTTGRSKGAMLTHDNLASNSLSLVGYWRFTDKDVLIHALPIYHTHGLFVATNVTLFSRASMIFLPKLDPDLIIKLMARRHGADGRADLLHAAAPELRAVARDHKAHAAVHLGLRTAARRNPSRMVGAHGPCGARALRHDRDQHEHVEPV
ncbi:acyl-CoA synthetase (AMP-forming)/AMP-acid ligase II [Bradyrhizobium sp. i1.3.1]